MNDRVDLYKLTYFITTKARVWFPSKRDNPINFFNHFKIFYNANVHKSANVKSYERTS